MKKLLIIASLIVSSTLSVIAQNQNAIGPADPEQESTKIEKFFRNDAHSHPYTAEEIQNFCDYITKNPVGKDLSNNGRVAVQKIGVAQHLYETIKDDGHKKKIWGLMMEMFKEIQTERDRLGVAPFSSEESWLYEPPALPMMSEKELEEAKKGMTSSNPRHQEAFSQKTQLSLKITTLEYIHTYLHRAITVQMKIPLPEISSALERSPAEKARTKVFLEKQAAAAGRKKPAPKAPAVEGK